MKSLFNCFDYQSKVRKILNILIFILIPLAFLSIPICSFKYELTYITWVFTSLLIVLMIFDILIFGHIVINNIMLCYVLFIISALISLLTVKFIGFIFTPFLLISISIVMYLYCLNDKRRCAPILMLIYIASFLFAIIYFVAYFREILSMSFDRLGGLFGDENDICIFMGFGFSISIFVLLFVNNKMLKIICLPCLALFLLDGVTSGSKIFYLIALIVTIVFVFLKIGKKRWYISLLILGVIIAVFIGILAIPAFSTLKVRILSLIATFTGIKFKEVKSVDLSSIYRMYMFEGGLDLFFKRPLFGYGTSGYQYFGGINDGWSHNHISESLCNYGIVGAFLFNAPIVATMYSVIKKERVDNFSFAILLFSFVCMISVAFFSEKIFAFIIPIGIAFADENKAFKTLRVIKK